MCYNSMNSNYKVPPSSAGVNSAEDRGLVLNNIGVTGGLREGIRARGKAEPAHVRTRASKNGSNPEKSSGVITSYSKTGVADRKNQGSRERHKSQGAEAPYPAMTGY
jgi:hypothetical protein